MATVAQAPLTEGSVPNQSAPERISILTLKLRNFKGASDTSVNLGGCETAVFGRNGAGKSTLADAVSYLLFDKDSLGRKDFEKRPIVNPHDEEPDVRRPGSNLARPDRDVIVEAEMTLQVGTKQITLRKEYISEVRGSRGQAAAATGNTTKHYVNTVPTSAGDYKMKVASIIASARDFGMMDADPEERFRLLTDPLYFNGKLHWKKRRELVIEACGDVSDEAVIASNSALEDLPDILGQHSLADYREIAKSAQTKLNEERKNLPALIAENKGYIKPVDRTLVQLNAEIEVEGKKRKTAEDNLREVGTSEAKTAKKKRIGEIDLEILGIRNEAARGQGDAIAIQQRELGALRTAADEAARLVGRIGRDIEEKNEVLENLNRKRETKLTEWTEIKSRKAPTPIAASTCNVCGQSLPEDQIQSVNTKALSEFNLKLSIDLEDNKAKGSAIAGAIEKTRGEVDTLAAALVTAKADAETTKAKVEAFKPSESAPAAQTVDPRITALEDEKKAIAAELVGMDGANTAEREKWEAKIKAADEAIAGFTAQIAQLRQNEQAQKRIDEHEAKEKAIGADLERLRYESSLMDEFVRTKVSLLENLINSRFKLARFKLFDTLENGNTEECCEATDQAGVPFSSLNHGSKLNIGLDIVNCLAEHFGFAPFVLIDNAESVTSILPTVGQQIRLVVSAADSELRFETQKESA